MRFVCPRWIRGNRGDLLSRLGILSALHYQGIEDLVVFCDKKQDIFPLRYRTVQNGYLYNLVPRREGLQELLRTDTVLWTAGLDLQDDSSLAKLMQTLCVFYSYRLMGLKVYAIAQGAGPITTTCGRMITRLILNCLNGFLARDPGTFQLLKGIKPNARLALGYDGIFLGDFDMGMVNLQEQEIIKGFAQKIDNQALIGFNLRQWFHFSSSLIPYQFARKQYLKKSQAKMDQFISASVRFIKMLRRKLGARVVLISAYEPGVQPWEDDLPWLQHIKAGFANDDHVMLCDQPLSLLAYCMLVSKLDLMIGTRLHSTLTALRFGVPAININYTIKGRDICQSLGFGDQVVELLDFIADPGLLFEKTLSVLHGNPTRSQVSEKIGKIISSNEETLREVIRCI
jgi:polysaccharide pyruvyl transferase WcaK-like protein